MNCILSLGYNAITRRILCALVTTTVLGVPMAAFSQPEVFTARIQTYKRIVTYNDLFSTQSFDWINLPFAGPDGSAYAVIAPGANDLIAVTFSTESRCSPSVTTTATDWCEVRVLVNGTVAEPSAPDATGVFAFDSTDSGTEGFGSYEAHSMTRALCVSNTTTQNLVIPIQVQVRVTDSGGTGGPSFWLDDWSLDISKHTPCL